MDYAYIADALWTEIKKRNHMPQEWLGKLTLYQAYAVQLEILRRRIAEGDRQAGWKVGLTSAAMRVQQGVDEPCFGYLLDSARMDSGVQIIYDDVIRPAIENELCLTLGSSLKGKVSVEEAQASIATVQAALEVVEARADFSVDLPLSVADNAQQYRFILGTAVDYDANMALDQTTVAVSFNGNVLQTAKGAEVMGNPIHSLVWLAEKLADYDLGLEAGTKIMSGSFTRQFAVQKDDVVSAGFSGFGVVDAHFV